MARRFDETAALIEPTRAPTLASDFATPALQSIFTGLLGGALWGGAAHLFGGDGLPIGAVCGLIFTSACWFCLLSDHRKWARERREGRDLDGDGHVGRPEPVLINSYAGRRALERDEREAMLQQWADFIRGCAADTSLRGWMRRGVSREQYGEMRDALLSAGWAKWKNEADQRQGWELTSDPATIIAAMG